MASPAPPPRLPPSASGPGSRADVLTDILETLRLQNMIHGRLELTAPWGARLEASRFPFFYAVFRGNCWLEVQGLSEPLQLGAGDYLLLTKGQSHVARDSPRARVRPLAEIAAAHPKDERGVLRYGGGGALTTMVCGHFIFEEGGRNPLVESLPPVIHVRGEDATSVEWLEATLQFVASESASGRPGAKTVITRLADVLLIQAVRAHLARGEAGTGSWLRALLDPKIGAALGLIHERADQPWTVDTLASSVAMSRSSFAARFALLAGEPPLRYLTRWRMQKAARLLREGQGGLAEIAGRVGYDNEAAFSKAFKRWGGRAPGAYRRAHWSELPESQP